MMGGCFSKPKIYLLDLYRLTYKIVDRPPLDWVSLATAGIDAGRRETNASRLGISAKKMGDYRQVGAVIPPTVRGSLRSQTPYSIRTVIMRRRSHRGTVV